MVAANDAIYNNADLQYQTQPMNRSGAFSEVGGGCVYLVHSQAFMIYSEDMPQMSD